MGNLEQAMQRIDTLKNMNLRVLEESPNRVRIAMPRAGNGNHLGGVYAGAIFSLAEFPFGMMCVDRFGTQEIVPVVGEVTIRYLAPAMSDLTIEMTVSEEEWVEIERETKAHGKFKIIKELEVKDDEDRVNAIVKATYFTLAVRK